MRTDAWGIEAGYADALGRRRNTPADTRRAVLAAMRVAPGAAAPPAGGPHVLRPGQTLPVSAPADLELEEGGALRVESATPHDLPLGYHRLRPLDGSPAADVIAAPAHCHLPPDLAAWGWAVQLYAARSAESWGLGDLADLRRLARWSAAAGAGFLLVNPLGASLPVLPQQASPYFPSSRRFHNPLYLRVEEVPGAAEVPGDLEPLAAAGRALDRDPRIDRDAVFRLKSEALERIWARFGGAPELDRYCAARGPALSEFATFCALAEHHGHGWRRWPGEHRERGAAGVTRFAAAHAARVRYHQWLQWLLDGQLARAQREIPLVHDLPIGVDPDGADAWAWQDLLAGDATVGAPPDEYNTRGQDWGVPPFIPHALRAAGYAPFIEMVRASFRHGGGLRVDHVVGLFRLFWIPRGLGPEAGAYVRYPALDLLAIIALESHRARAVVVGEDLGTVEARTRKDLAAHGVLSTRLMWFETDRPARYPRLAQASVTTHDLPTIAGLWTGADLESQRALGLSPNEAGTEAIRERLSAWTGLGPAADPAEVIRRTHRLLAEAPSMMITAALEDALGVEERPNMPATTEAARPNWSRALPRPLEQIETDPLVRDVSRALAARGPAPASPARARRRPRAERTGSGGLRPGGEGEVSAARGR